MYIEKKDKMKRLKSVNEIRKAENKEEVGREQRRKK